MTKKYLLLGLLFMAFFCSCQSESVIESTPPTGIWEELVWVPEIDESGKTVFVEKTFDEIPAAVKDTLVFMATRIAFLESSRVELTVRYGSGKRTPSRDSLNCYSGPISIDYIRGSYVLGDRNDILGNALKSITVTGMFEGATSSTLPDACASSGTFQRIYDFSYENKEKNILRMGYSDSTRVNIQVFKQI